ncbi:MAG: 1,4-beta-glucanase, partial [Ruminococcus sp.]
QTWTSMTPGNTISWGGPLEAAYLQDGGRAWIQNKAIHWTGAIVLDPNDSSRILVTSGNGVFACDNTWDECPQFYFEADGIEEVVALDMVSSKGKNPFSAIGDYDGFEHTSKTESIQHQPNMGSTAAIAACPSNPDVMVRAAQNDNTTYYTLDGGDSWVEMNGTSGGGKAAITELKNGTYRIFRTGNGSASYTDDFGETWNNCSGIKGSKELRLTVDEENPQYVYGYTAQYNDYWFYDTSKSEPTFEDAHYVFMVSDDYGATFTAQDTCKYDQCDVANRIGYLGEGEMVLGAGWNGAYYTSDYGKTIEKLDSVSYCKTIGYGAPEEAGGVNTLYMYGKPQESDVEGVYRSTDAGKTWVLINSEHLYGGTGNGNFLVGDMNEFGTVYMSTVGCGIVYMQSAGVITDPKPTTTTTTTTTTETGETTTTTETTTETGETTTTVETTTETGETTTTTSDVVTTTSDTTTTATIAPGNDDLIGDVNVDGKVDLTDAICMNKYLAGQMELGEQAMRSANCYQDGTPTVDEADGNALISFVIMLITELPEQVTLE